MGNFLDRNYAAIDGVLLKYSGAEEELTLPAALNGMPLHTVGMGCFMGMKDLCSVKLPAGIRSIGEKAFSGCAQLREAYFNGLPERIDSNAFEGCRDLRSVYLHQLALPRDVYASICAGALHTNTESVALRFPSFGPLAFLQSWLRVSAAQYIPPACPALFVDLPESKELFYKKAPLRCFDFGGGRQALPELTAFCNLMRSRTDLRLADGEKENDALSRTETPVPAKKTAVLCFNENDAKHVEDTVYVDAESHIGRFFFQSGVTVTGENGALYQVYCRNYLSGRTDLPYLRKEFTVLKDGKRIIDRKEAEAVYARYRLLTLL